MAGIAAIIGFDAENNADLVRMMLSRIKHRGPGYEGTFAAAGAVLGFVGKETDAPSNADSMPYIDAHHQTAIACDAEIYNHESIIPDDSQAQSPTSRSARAITTAVLSSDTTFGEKLEGPFSFVLHKNDCTYVGRDPLGVAPLYMADRGDLTLLASELKALSGLGSNIRIFPPGHIYRTSDALRRYHTLRSCSAHPQDFEPLRQELRTLMDTAVETRLSFCASKKGVLLSGGVDSSVIAALVSKHIPGVDSFTVGMKESEDVPFARMVADHLKTNHHEYIYDLEEVLNVLPDVIYHLESFDAPLVRSSIANYIASREACRHVDTILIGEGGDENFGGYHHIKRIDNPKDQQRELVRLLQGLHSNGFMRTDRMNWAHSLNVRAPFFDSAVVQFCLTIPPALKFYGEEQIEKWILRKAFEDDLPKEVAFRPKKQFARGSGSDDLLTRYAEREIGDEDFAAEKKRYPMIDLRWKEELLYFRIFRSHFGDDPATLSTVGQWYE